MLETVAGRRPLTDDGLAEAHTYPPRVVAGIAGLPGENVPGDPPSAAGKADAGTVPAESESKA